MAQEDCCTIENTTSDLYPLLMITWLSFCQNGIWPSVLPYACATYRSTTTVDLYWFASFAPSLGAPLAAALAAFTVHNRCQLIAAVFWNSSTFFMLFAALVHKPMGGSLGAGVLATLSIVGYLGICYGKAALLTSLRMRCGNEENRLRKAGISMQLGAIAGTLLFFILVNFTRLF
eukprot:gnl/MRDRNA2_/MRDRNA2_16218_c0_seq1.p1 gnl/MRDRNA2_/MRDRNA2_16218_c0~~gnl/MRDRNA2_/MRDRNA2_16218_c0_seq1.p1  ORF type:complete len:193 (+),score=31.32 gnl/MRDRNA2_/MRDRNA2_16218_c0_seq1:57-581(+)